MNPQPVSRRERKKEITRQSILDAAAELFRDFGYETTSVEDIAEKADVSKRTLYNTFDSKESIAIALRFQTFEKNIDSAFQLRNQGKSALHCIEYFVMECARWTKENPALAEEIYIKGPVLPPPKIVIGPNPLVNMPRFVQGMLQLVVMAQKNGELNSSVEPHFVCITIGFLTMHSALEYLQSKDFTTPEEIYRKNFKAILGGFEVRKS